MLLLLWGNALLVCFQVFVFVLILLNLHLLFYNFIQDGWNRDVIVLFQNFYHDLLILYLDNVEGLHSLRRKHGKWNANNCFCQLILEPCADDWRRAIRFGYLTWQQILLWGIWLLPSSCIIWTFWCLWIIRFVLTWSFLYRSWNLYLFFHLVFLCFHCKITQNIW